MAVLLGYGLSSHSSSCCRGREDGACQAALAQLETSRSMPRAPHCLVLRCIFVCIFLLCERRKRKQKARPLFKLAHSYTLGQILDTHARERPWTSWPRAESTREKSNASYSAQTNLSSVLAHHLLWYLHHHHHHCFLFQKRYIFCFIIFFQLK